MKKVLSGFSIFLVGVSVSTMAAATTVDPLRPPVTNMTYVRVDSNMPQTVDVTVVTHDPQPGDWFTSSDYPYLMTANSTYKIDGGGTRMGILERREVRMPYSSTYSTDVDISVGDYEPCTFNIASSARGTAATITMKTIPMSKNSCGFVMNPLTKAFVIPHAYPYLIFNVAPVVKKDMP